MDGSLQGYAIDVTTAAADSGGQQFRGLIVRVGKLELVQDSHDLQQVAQGFSFRCAGEQPVFLTQPGQRGF